MDAARYGFAAVFVLAALYGVIRASWHATHGPTRHAPPEAGPVFSGRRQAAIILTVLLVAVILAAFAT